MYIPMFVPPFTFLEDTVFPGAVRRKYGELWTMYRTFLVIFAYLMLFCYDSNDIFNVCCVYAHIGIISSLLYFKEYFSLSILYGLFRLAFQFCLLL